MFYEAVYEDNYVMDLQLGLWNNILNWFYRWRFLYDLCNKTSNARD